MNKALIILSLFMCVKLSAQSEKESLSIFDKHNEVRIGVIKILAGPIFEGTYEYVKNRNVGYGASLLVNFNSENDYFENLSVTPFFRMYFDRDEQYGAKGFFVESFLSFYSGDDNYDYSGNNTNTSHFDTAFGFSLGQKWVNSAGFIFEIKLGGGRNLLGNAPEGGVLKGDFSIGYRF
jgi:hypothetical protein